MGFVLARRLPKWWKTQSSHSQHKLLLKRFSSSIEANAYAERLKSISPRRWATYTGITLTGGSLIWLFCLSKDPPNVVKVTRMELSVLSSLILYRIKLDATQQRHGMLDFVYNLSKTPQGRQILLRSKLWKHTVEAMENDLVQDEYLPKVISCLKFLCDDPLTAKEALLILPAAVLQAIFESDNTEAEEVLSTLSGFAMSDLAEKLNSLDKVEGHPKGGGLARSRRDVLMALANLADEASDDKALCAWDFESLLATLRATRTPKRASLIAALLLNRILESESRDESQCNALNLVLTDTPMSSILSSEVEGRDILLLHWILIQLLEVMNKHLSSDHTNKGGNCNLDVVSRLCMEATRRAIIDLSFRRTESADAIDVCCSTFELLGKLMTSEVQSEQLSCTSVVHGCLELLNLASQDDLRGYQDQITPCILSMIGVVEQLSMSGLNGSSLPLTNFDEDQETYSQVEMTLADTPLNNQYAEIRRTLNGAIDAPLFDAMLLLDSALKSANAPGTPHILSSLRNAMDNILGDVTTRSKQNPDSFAPLLQLWAAYCCNALFSSTAAEGYNDKDISRPHEMSRKNAVQEAMKRKLSLVEASKKEHTGVARIPPYFDFQYVPRVQKVGLEPLCELSKALVFASDSVDHNLSSFRVGLPSLSKAVLKGVLATEAKNARKTQDESRTEYTSHANMKLIRNSVRTLADIMYHCTSPDELQLWELSEFEDWHALLQQTLQASDLKTVCHSRRASINLAQRTSMLGSSTRLDDVPLYGDMVYPLVDNTRGSKEDVAVDLVFIHGLQGTALKTWRCPKMKVHDHMLGLWKMVQEKIGQEGKPDTEAVVQSPAGTGTTESADVLQHAHWDHIGSRFRRLARGEIWKHDDAELVVNGRKMPLWPVSWLPYDLLQKYNIRCRILCVEYDANLWEGHGYRPTLSVENAAERVKSQLENARVGSTDKQSVIYVTHSMGGLITKEMLTRSSLRNRSEASGLSSEATKEPASPLMTNCAGVVFFSVPHRGSPLANYVRHTQWPLIRSYLSVTAPVQQLEENNQFLLHLNDTFIDAISEVNADCLSIAEGKGSRVSGALPSIHVVPQTNAYPGIGRLVVIPNADHVTVCKPSSREDPRYIEARDFIGKQIASRNS